MGFSMCDKLYARCICVHILVGADCISAYVNACPRADRAFGYVALASSRSFEQCKTVLIIKKEKQTVSCSRKQIYLALFPTACISAVSEITEAAYRPVAPPLGLES